MLRYIILVVCLMTLQRDVHVSSCDTNCADKPVLTPSRLVVKYGDPMSATCSVLQSAGKDELFSLEVPVGVKSENGTTIKWTVDNMTEWDISPSCYYTDGDKQCCTPLPVTVYKPPDSVSISISDHSGFMLEGRQYTLQCEVRNAAPIQNLSVTFYRGNTPLGRPGSVNSTEKKPASETYDWSFNASKEDDGAQYWCEAELELGPEGPQPPPMMKSQHVITTVHYKPHLLPESHPDPITIKEGDPLKLNCSAVGNPQPKYNWTFPAETKSTINGSVLTVDPVTSADKGQYTCTVSNSLGNQTVTFKVDVQHKPRLLEKSHPDPITIKEGDPLKLNCSAVGNPQPKYSWTFPAETKSTINGSVLTVASVTSADKGQYTCTASNSLGNQTVTFKVDVQRLTSSTLPPTTTPNRSTASNVLQVFTLGCALLLSVLF